MKQVHGGDIFRYRGCLDFSTNLNPLGMPVSVKEAAEASISHLTEYPEPGSESLCRAIAAAEGIPWEQVICGNGAAELIFSFVRTLKPEEALVQAPAFAEYEQALRAEECCIRRAYLREERDYITERDFPELITEKTDLVFLCSPNNPTGIPVKKELLIQILEKCRETGTFLFLDECFVDFVSGPENLTMTGYLKDFPNLFILKAFTKCFGMAGLRLGYGMCGDREFVKRMRSGMQPWNVSVPAQAAGIAALKETEFIKKGRTVVLEERPFLVRILQEAGFRVFPSQANYLLFRGREDLFERMLEHGILIRDCSNYPGLTRGYFRIAVKTHAENIRFQEALKQITTERGKQDG